MKKTLRTIIAILTAGIMLITFAACEDKKDEPVEENTVKEDTFIKEIFENLTSSNTYTEWKKMNPDLQIGEKLDGSKIIFTVSSDRETDEEDEGDITNDGTVLDGEYVFTHDGDYVTYTSQDAKHMNNPFLVLVRNNILDYYEVDTVAANDYLADVYESGEESTYYITDENALTVKIYSAGKWDLN